jgi:uncharacterized protein
MNSNTQTLLIDGPAGAIELAIDEPQGAFRGVAVVAHPHPLFGGSLSNKVVQTLARAFVQQGWRTVRFNFRGVGRSAGEHDHGKGELDDLLAVIAAQAPSGPLCLAGFSFGAFVTSHAVARLHTQRPLERVVLVGTAASRFDVAPIAQELHARTLVIHGEADDTVPLASVLDWARPQHLPVMVVPGVAHFFHGQLPLLKSLTLRHLEA